LLFSNFSLHTHLSQHEKKIKALRNSNQKEDGSFLLCVRNSLQITPTPLNDFHIIFHPPPQDVQWQKNFGAGKKIMHHHYPARRIIKKGKLRLQRRQQHKTGVRFIPG